MRRSRVAKLVRAGLPVAMGCVAGGGAMLSLTMFHYHRDALGTQVFLGSVALVAGALALARAWVED